MGLPIIDESLGFLLLLIFAVLLSFYSVTIQRRQLLYGQECLARLPPVYPLKLTAGAVVVGCLGYFFLLAQRSADAEGQSEAQRRSGRRNLAASFLVLAAALIRLFDIREVEQERLCGQEALTFGPLPD